jgi:hypothetical protein
MALPKFMKTIQDQVVDPRLEQTKPFMIGLVLRSDYVADTNDPSASPRAILDAAVYDGSGQVSHSFKDVPIARIIGLQFSLPPIGTSVLLAFTSENRKTPIAVAILDSSITSAATSDTMVPKLPPGLLFK